MLKKKLIALVFLALLFAGIVAIIFEVSFHSFSNPANNNSVIGNQSSSNETFVYYTSESRNVQVCNDLYVPVCGYPAKQTFSNSCFACLDLRVKYYIKGECLH